MLCMLCYVMIIAPAKRAVENLCYWQTYLFDAYSDPFDLVSLGSKSRHLSKIIFIYVLEIKDIIRCFGWGKQTLTMGRSLQTITVCQSTFLRRALVERHTILWRSTYQQKIPWETPLQSTLRAKRNAICVKQLWQICTVACQPNVKPTAIRNSQFCCRMDYRMREKNILDSASTHIELSRNATDHGRTKSKFCVCAIVWYRVHPYQHNSIEKISKRFTVIFGSARRLRYKRASYLYWLHTTNAFIHSHTCVFAIYRRLIIDEYDGAYPSFRQLVWSALSVTKQIEFHLNHFG